MWVCILKQPLQWQGCVLGYCARQDRVKLIGVSYNKLIGVGYKLIGAGCYKSTIIYGLNSANWRQ